VTHKSWHSLPEYQALRASVFLCFTSPVYCEPTRIFVSLEVNASDEDLYWIFPGDAGFHDKVARHGAKVAAIKVSRSGVNAPWADELLAAFWQQVMDALIAPGGCHSLLVKGPVKDA